MKNKRLIEMTKNICILFLSISALYLLNKVALYNGFLDIFSQTQVKNQMEHNKNEKEYFRVDVEPVRIAVNNQTGVFATQFDTEIIGTLFENQLGSLFREALVGVTQLDTISREEWINQFQQNRWIYYDFSCVYPISHLASWLGSENVNSTLSATLSSCILVYQDMESLLVFADDFNGRYHICLLDSTVSNRLKNTIEKYESNNAVLAFQNEQFDVFDEVVIIGEDAPILPYYESSNPVKKWTDNDRNEMLTSLLFNPKAITVYESAEGVVIQEGRDTLRILSQGTLTFHTSSDEAKRYMVDTSQVGEIIEQTQEILFSALSNENNEAKINLIDVKYNEDGSIVASYGYRLHGVPVQLYSDEYCARFYIQDGVVRDFVIHLRQYTSNDQVEILLPEEHVAAIVKGENRTNVKISPVYIDSGEDKQMNITWKAY